MKAITIVTGAAGSGKTMLACRMALDRLRANQVSKIVLTRPVVGVEEDLGFLPGTLEEKMKPWVAPMLDYIKKTQVEIVPLAYMRGRTFKNTFVIADEMQNSTRNQMKMILTRLGDNSNMVVTGDLEQSDLLSTNGLGDLVYRMRLDAGPYKYLEHIHMNEVHRHPAIVEVLKMYDAE
jgi:phosphate starvation-inducible PhoH-like protein